MIFFVECVVDSVAGDVVLVVSGVDFVIFAGSVVGVVFLVAPVVVDETFEGVVEVGSFVVSFIVVVDETTTLTVDDDGCSVVVVVVFGFGEVLRLCV